MYLTWAGPETQSGDRISGFPGTLTGHTQLQRLGELCIFWGIIVLYTAAIRPTLAPLHPLQCEVPRQVGLQRVLLPALCQRKERFGSGGSWGHARLEPHRTRGQ